MSSLQETHSINITVNRRTKLHSLLLEFVQAQTALGQPAKGIEQAFAAKLQISPSMLSQIKKSRPISDKLARQIEALCDRPNGWLDEPCVDSTLHIETEAEVAFIAAAKLAWRQSNARQKQALLRSMKEVAGQSESGPTHLPRRHSC